MNRLGLHLPDRDYLEQAEIDAIRDLQPVVMLAMAYDADKGGAAQVSDIANELGHADLLVRMAGDGIVAIDPMEWANRCAERASRYSAPRLHILPANEANYAGEGFDGDLNYLIGWLGDFARAYRLDRPFDILHLPAPWAGWVGENEKRAIEYWQAARDAGLLDLYDEVDAHCYAAGFDLWRRCASLTSRQPWITETNQLPMSDMAEALDDSQPRRAKAVIYFTLRWVNYSGNGQQWRDDDIMSLMRFDNLYQDFKAVNSGAVTIDPLPPPEEDHVPEFVLGFKDKADELGADIVGEPLEDQDYLPLASGGEIAFQTTDKGLMVYSKAANQAHFLPGARR